MLVDDGGGDVDFEALEAGGGRMLALYKIKRIRMYGRGDVGYEMARWEERKRGRGM